MPLVNSNNTKEFALDIRKWTLFAVSSFGVGHVGGALSIADCLAVLYNGVMKINPLNPIDVTRDRLVLSKGHCGPALYATLGLKGYFPLDILKTLNKPNTILPSHCDRTKTPGIDMTTGSLGQGASSAAGIALGIKLRGFDSYVYLILGDGECQEGQVWEMALFAAQNKLNNLIAFIDNNKIQLDGFTDDINSLGDIGAKFGEFGWFSQTIDGHDLYAIESAISVAKNQSQGRPSVIVLDTVKGKGWDEIEGTIKSHSMNVSSEDYYHFLKSIDKWKGEIK
ncbi:transketolase [Erysipelothrix larvae]|uniref:Transketolase n=1 Tax=Erysipelothrix larvae TaxID=1514105 RepID=A0A0X8H0V5_9FIRM|nr:transketolase [Erysipelothrix larvae]AMC93981.1 transketolase [Erysipelothrix larvae]